MNTGADTTRPVPAPDTAARSALIAIAAVSVATSATFVVYDWMAPSISVLFFPAVIASAIYGGYVGAALATVLSTISVAYFFVPPRQSFDIGLDDSIRLAVFSTVSFTTAWLGLAWRRAERARSESAADLRKAVGTLSDMTAWPVVVGPDTSRSLHRILVHAALVMNARTVVVAWETDDEPWLFLTSSANAEATSKIGPQMRPDVAKALGDATFLSEEPYADSLVVTDVSGVLGEWRGTALDAELSEWVPQGPIISSPFRTEHVSGRVFFSAEAKANSSAIPTAQLVAREIGNSLGQLCMAERAQDLMFREYRLRVARDLHDGVLQAMTGIRLTLQELADQADADGTGEALMASERTLALHQRELRMFIEELRPMGRPAGPSDSVATQLGELCDRLSHEWHTPVTLRLEPADPIIPSSVERTLRMALQEAIVNAIKHGHPSRVTVAAFVGASRVHVSVADDGRGFPYKGRFEHEEMAARQIGPVSLRERVEDWGGRLTIESRTLGSTVEFSLPTSEPMRVPASVP